MQSEKKWLRTNSGEHHHLKEGLKPVRRSNREKETRKESCCVNSGSFWLEELAISFLRNQKTGDKVEEKHLRNP